MGIRWQITFFKIEFYKICESLCHTRWKILFTNGMEGVARLERAQLIFLIFYKLVCNFGRVEAAARENLKDKLNV